MIISFNPSIFKSSDTEIQAVLAEILKALMTTDIHLVEFKTMNTIFYNEEGKYTFNSNQISEYLSSRQKISLKEILNKKSREKITGLYKQHLLQIIVRIDEDGKEIHPQSAYRIITERSKIIVENGINDWKFIQSICQKYSSIKIKRQSIYQLLDRAIKNGILESEHSGGVGEIARVTERWIRDERYRNIFRYKLMAVFDSDRENSSQLTQNKSKIEYFKGRRINCISDCIHESTDLIVWHVFYKKKLENYVPLNVLLRNITSMPQKQKNYLASKTRAISF